MMTSEDVAKRIIKVIENKKRIFYLLVLVNKLICIFNKFITYFTAIKTCRLNFKKR